MLPLHKNCILLPNEISELGRATQGVKIMKVGDETKIVSMAKVIKEDDDKGDDSKDDEDNDQLRI